MNKINSDTMGVIYCAGDLLFKTIFYR